LFCCSEFDCLICILFCDWTTDLILNKVGPAVTQSGCNFSFDGLVWWFVVATESENFLCTQLSVELLKCLGLMFNLLRIAAHIMLYSIFIIEDMTKLMKNMFRIKDDEEPLSVTTSPSGAASLTAESCAPSSTLGSHYIIERGGESPATKLPHSHLIIQGVLAKESHQIGGGGLAA
jgi:hypothetical protein